MALQALPLTGRASCASAIFLSVSNDDEMLAGLLAPWMPIAMIQFPSSIVAGSEISKGERAID
jgi:hypothetical protein